MELFSGVYKKMEPRMEDDPEKDGGKTQFQLELNRWFESRGIIADLRSHLRHLMVTALQSAQLGAKPFDRSSPKAQALNLMVAEYLFRHRCHYTLSVFTSEVPTLANFNLDAVLQGGKDLANKKLPHKNRFQENEVDEIFDALGMSSRVRELTLLKSRYLEKGNETSLLQLFLQMAIQMATKLQVQHNLESHAEEGERILSKEWSSKIIDVLLSEKMSPPQITALEENIFRITESETRRAVAEERRLQMQVLAKREKRIQEYLRKHEDEIFCRLTEAERELTTRKITIDEELTERENHLAKMALEWNTKHQEIVGLSKKFHNIENENKSLKKKLKELEDENQGLRTQGQGQTRTILDLQEEVNSLLNKLKEVTDSKAILSERIQVLIDREKKEILAGREHANQANPQDSLEIPLLWSQNMTLDCGVPVSSQNKFGGKMKLDEFARENQPLPHPDRWNVESARAFRDSDDSGLNKRDSSEEEEEDTSLSSSLRDIIQGVHEKVRVLEEKSDRLNRNYLEYKLKCISTDSDSETSKSPSTKSPAANTPEGIVSSETKFAQTNVQDPFVKIQKLKETKEETVDFERSLVKVPESPTAPIARTPTKRQLLNREFFLQKRHLLKELEKQKGESLPPIVDPSSSSEESMPSSQTTRTHKSSAKPPALNSARSDKNLEEKALPERSNQMLRSDKDCLALLEEARIKSPQPSARKPLRQQILLSDTEKEEAGEGKKEKAFLRSESTSPRSTSSPKLSADKKSPSDGFW